MNWPKLKSSGNGRLRRGALVAGLAGTMLLGVGVSTAEAAVVGTDLGAVTLVPATGPLSTTPTFSTTEACPANFQTSATLWGIESDGVTPDFIGASDGGTAAAFTGTLNSNASVSLLQTIGNYSAGGVEEIYVECASGPGGTGNTTDVMYNFIHYNANGTYTVSTGGGTVPVGEVGGLILAGLAAIALVFVQVRRRMTRRAQPIAG